MAYSDKFHLRRIGRPIYEALAVAVSRTAKTNGISELPIADIGSSIGVFLSEMAKLTKCKNPNKLVGVDFGESVLNNYLNEYSHFFHHNLNSSEVPKIPGGPFSVMTSWETAEHIDEAFAKKIVFVFANNISENGVVIFGAARPGQKGRHHVNCKPPEYWHDLFSKQGITLDNDLTEKYRNTLRSKCRGCGVYFSNTYCLVKKPR